MPAGYSFVADDRVQIVGDEFPPERRPEDDERNQDECGEDS
jgi:hypothetical protein